MSPRKSRPLHTKLVRHLLAMCRTPLFRLTLSAPSVNQRCINFFDFVCSLGNKVINELVKFIQESLPWIKKDKQTSFLIKHEDHAVLNNLPSLVIPRKCHALPNITFSTILKIIHL